MHELVTTCAENVILVVSSRGLDKGGFYFNGNCSQYCLTTLYVCAEGFFSFLGFRFFAAFPPAKHSVAQQSKVILRGQAPSEAVLIFGTRYSHVRLCVDSMNRTAKWQKCAFLGNRM